MSLAHHPLTHRPNWLAVLILLILIDLSPRTLGTPPGSDVQPVPLPKGIPQSLQLSKSVAQLPFDAMSSLRDGVGVQEAPLGGKIGSVGTMRVLIVLVKTPAASIPFSSNYVRQVVFGHLLGDTNLPGPSASVADYYKAASLGKLRIEGEVIDWLTLGSGAPRWKSPDDSSFIAYIAKQANEQTAFAKFDNDDLSGNGSNRSTDGNVDFLAIVYAAANAESKGISYRNKYSCLHNTNGNLTGKPWRPAKAKDGIIGVEDFIFVPAGELTDYSIGVFAHEVGHFLGLPDLYKRPSRRDDWFPTDMGHWCIMCWGCRRTNSPGAPLIGSAKFPPLFSAWSRDFLGWGDPVYIEPNITATINSLRVGSYGIIDDVGSTGEKLLIELYTPPSATSPWGTNVLPATTSGFLLWHVDETVGKRPINGEFLWPSAPVKMGQNDFVFQPEALNNDPGLKSSIVGRPLVRLIAADGLLGLEDAQDMLPHSSQLFGDATLLFNDMSRGFSFYRVSALPTLQLNLSNRSIQWKPQFPTTPKNSIAAQPASPQPVFPPDEFAVLKRVSENTNNLSNASFRTDFSRVPASDVAIYARQENFLELPALHEQLRTAPLDVIPVGAPANFKAAARQFLNRPDTQACCVISEDNTYLQKLFDFQVPIIGTTPIEDVRNRTNALRELFSVKPGQVQLIFETNEISDPKNPSLSTVTCSFVARIGDKTLPLSGLGATLTYTNRESLTAVTLNRSASITKLPDNPTPRISKEEAITALNTRFNNRFPKQTKFSADLELHSKEPRGTEWVLAYHVKIEMPLARPVYAYVDATDGATLP